VRRAVDEELGRVTTVKIHNQTYQVRSEGDPEYIRTLAVYVDKRMKEVFESTPAVDSLKVAVLAALSIADECFSLREERDRITDDVFEKGERMSSLLAPFVDIEPS